MRQNHAVALTIAVMVVLYRTILDVVGPTDRHLALHEHVLALSAAALFTFSPINWISSNTAGPIPLEMVLFAGIIHTAAAFASVPSTGNGVRVMALAALLGLGNAAFVPFLVPILPWMFGVRRKHSKEPLVCILLPCCTAIRLFLTALSCALLSSVN